MDGPSAWYESFPSFCLSHVAGRGHLLHKYLSVLLDRFADIHECDHRFLQNVGYVCDSFVMPARDAGRGVLEVVLA